MTTEEMKQLFENLKKWHSENIAQMKIIANSSEDVNFKFQDKKGNTVDMPSEMSKGFRLGLSTAIEIVGKFPLILVKNENNNN